jgi:hypothetical protein
MNYQSWKDWGEKRTIKAPDGDIVRAFPQHQIYLEDGIFKQTRSGPNWQGGILTLSTCKHYTRTANTEWLHTWFAGFTPKVGCGENYLLFLARISHVFDSNYDMGWYLNRHHRKAWLQKIAPQSNLGDIYMPKRTPLTDRTKYNHKNYYTPVGHVRMEMDKKWEVPKWQKDINYEAKGRRPACFLFDNVHLFKRPVFVSTRPLHRSGYKGTISDLRRGVTRV